MVWLLRWREMPGPLSDAPVDRSNSISPCLCPAPSSSIPYTAPALVPMLSRSSKYNGCGERECLGGAHTSEFSYIKKRRKSSVPAERVETACLLTSPKIELLFCVCSNLPDFPRVKHCARCWRDMCLGPHLCRSQVTLVAFWISASWK